MVGVSEVGRNSGGFMIDREQLKRDVVNQLFWDDRVDAAAVQVEAKAMPWRLRA
jgi:hypothetical protein